MRNPEFIVDTLTGTELRSGRFYVSAETKLTGRLVDQSTIFADLASPGIQSNAAEAIHSFIFIRFTDISKTVQPEFMRFVHEMTASGRVFAISGPDTCFFCDNKTTPGLRDELPGMVMTVASLCLIGTERNPANALVCFKLYDAGLNRAVEDLEPVKRALTRFPWRLVRYIFHDHKPIWPGGGVGKPFERAVAICMDQQFVVREDGGH